MALAVNHIRMIITRYLTRIWGCLLDNWWALWISSPPTVVRQTMTDSAVVSTLAADSESSAVDSNPVTSKQRLVDRLLTLAVVVALCATQAAWMIFLGWAALHLLS
jgi:hypothetical protein